MRKPFEPISGHDLFRAHQAGDVIPGEIDSWDVVTRWVNQQISADKAEYERRREVLKRIHRHCPDNLWAAVAGDAICQMEIVPSGKREW